MVNSQVKLVSHLYKMRYLIYTAISVLIVVFFAMFTSPVSAVDTVPTKMNFQGRLTDTAGNVKANGTYNMRFKLYTVASGGSNVWAEDRLVSATQGVTITNGSFSVQLGSITTLPANLFATGQLYLEVEFPTPASATTASPVWTEGAMTPRNQMLTSAYAYNSETVDGIDGAALAQLSANNTFTGTNSLQSTSATAFRVQSAAAANTFLTVDTSGGQITVGNSAADGTAVLLRLDDKNTTGDPTGVAGATYYNSFSGKFRCFQGAAWVDCIGAGGGGGTLQDAYDNSASPALITTTTAKGINVTAGAAPTVDMVAISNAGFGTTTASVNGLSINYVGGAGAIESSGQRIDLTPGTTSGSTWNGLKIVANATGATAGVTEYGVQLNGPTSQGAGTEAAISIDANWDAGLHMVAKNGEPGTPVAADSMYVYATKYAGRSLLAQKGTSGVAFAYQPALFEQAISILSPGGGALPNYLGGSWTIDTTASHPTSTEVLGFGTQFATAATANDTAGAFQTGTQYIRGSTAGSNGFFSVSRVGLSDAGGYGSGATGARIWSGLTSQASAALMTTADSPAGHFAGFQYSTNRADTTWKLLTRDGATAVTPIDTTMTVAASKVYDFYLYMKPAGITLYWRVDNLTDGTTVEGTTAANLPGTTTAMRGAVGIQTLTTTARTIRVNKVYIEADQ